MRKDLKYLIDGLMFITITSIAAIGLLMAFVIPSGRQGPESRFFLGLHRHDWGDIHLYLSLFFLGLLALHIWLNWTWIKQATKSYVGEYWKKVLLGLCGAWLLVIFIAYLIARF
jgi:hypothetical protein